MEASVSPPFHLKEMYTLSRKRRGGTFFFSRVNINRLFSSCVLSACRQGRVEAICSCLCVTPANIHTSQAVQKFHFFIHILQKKNHKLKEKAYFVFICMLLSSRTNNIGFFFVHICVYLFQLMSGALSSFQFLFI